MAKTKNNFKPLLVELRPSKITPQGIGVFATVTIKKGNKIFNGVRMNDFKYIVSWSVFHRLPRKTRLKVLAYCIGMPKGFIPPDKYDFNNLSIGWYLNHSCTGNVGFDRQGNFIAIRNIRPNEELSYDYGLIETNPKFKMHCNCGSSTCRKIITGNDWKYLKTKPEKFKFMHAYLKINKA